MHLLFLRCTHRTPPSLQADYVKALMAGSIAFVCASLSFFCFGQVPLVLPLFVGLFYECVFNDQSLEGLQRKLQSPDDP